jgi:hypothetical protein
MTVDTFYFVKFNFIRHFFEFSQISLLFTDTWEVLKQMPQPRSFHGCIAMPNPDNFLVVGSWDSGDRQINIIKILHILPKFF